jgi:molybdenum cofactor guanylyltransferase
MGESKAWLRFGSEALLQRIVRRLLEVAGPVVVVRAREQRIPELPPNVAIAEDTRADRGPLQGLARGLNALENQVELAFVSSTDAPFVDQTLISLLERHCDPLDDIVAPYAEGRPHPLAALYNLRVLPEVEKMLSNDQLRLMDLLGRVSTRLVPEADLRRVDPQLRCLRNLNTPEAYQTALAEDLEA